MELFNTAKTNIIKLPIKKLAKEQQLSRVVLPRLYNDGKPLSAKMSQGLNNESLQLKLQIKLLNDGVIKTSS
jgi:hypothetical protein